MSCCCSYYATHCVSLFLSLSLSLFLGLSASVCLCLCLSLSLSLIDKPAMDINALVNSRVASYLDGDRNEQ